MSTTQTQPAHTPQAQRLLAFIKDHGWPAWINADQSVTFSSPFISPQGNGTEETTVHTFNEARIALGY